MTSHDDLDRRLTAWLDEEVAPLAPSGLAKTVSERVAGTRRLPGWATTERWITMETRARFGAVPRAAIVLLAFGLLTALTAGTIAVGSAVTRGSDNGLIVYQHASGDLWTIGPDGSDPQPLIETDTSLSNPAWSPDGTHLAYWEDSGPGGSNDLVVSRADGSGRTVAASDVGIVTGWLPPEWSPDGTQLAFSAEVPNLASPTACPRVNGHFCDSRIFVAAPDGSTGAVQVGDPDLDARSPAWSPDGAFIAFGGGSAFEDVRLHVMDPDGSNVREVGNVVGEEWAMLRLDWSPDGSTIVGTSGMQVWDIWAFPTDGGEATNLSAVEAEGTADQLFPAYAPDGAIAWYQGGLQLCNCLVIQEPDAPMTELAGFELPPTWSPDGRFIVARPAGLSGELTIVDRHGNVQAAIEDVGDNEYGVSWQAVGG